MASIGGHIFATSCWESKKRDGGCFLFCSSRNWGESRHSALNDTTLCFTDANRFGAGSSKHVEYFQLPHEIFGTLGDGANTYKNYVALTSNFMIPYIMQITLSAPSLTDSEIHSPIIKLVIKLYTLRHNNIFSGGDNNVDMLSP